MQHAMSIHVLKPQSMAALPGNTQRCSALHCSRQGDAICQTDPLQVLESMALAALVVWCSELLWPIRTSS